MSDNLAHTYHMPTGFIKSKPYNYLKIAKWKPGTKTDTGLPLIESPIPLTCVVPGSGYRTYKDNDKNDLTFEVRDDGSESFDAIKEQSYIFAGGDQFVIQSVSKNVDLVSTATVTASQRVNADFKRLRNPTTFLDGDMDDGKSDEVFTPIEDLFDWFFAPYQEGEGDLLFQPVLEGYFPARGYKRPSNIDGDQLLTLVKQTWPGTIIYGFGNYIIFQGYAEQRSDEYGELKNVREVETGMRFDQLKDTKDVQIDRDINPVVNAIKVKAATYDPNPKTVDKDGNVEEEELNVIKAKPYFPNCLITSDHSIKKWGLRVADEVLEGFTSLRAATAAAREKMQTDPTISIKATINHPGKLEECPIPGHVYTFGVSSESKVYHVKVVGFTWYPNNPGKGTQLVLSNADPSLKAVLHKRFTHDLELSPTVTAFKNHLKDDDTDGSDDFSDVPEINSDDQLDRPDDDGNGGEDSKHRHDKDKQKKKATKADGKAHLPISDKAGTRAHISKFGGLTVNFKNRSVNIRATDDDHLKSLAKGDWTEQDTSDVNDEGPDEWRHLAMGYFGGEEGTFVSTGKRSRQYYMQSDWYLGQNTFTNYGLWATTAPSITLRAGVEDSDYYQETDQNEDGEFHHTGYPGTLKLKWHKYKDGGQWINTQEEKQPGKLAGLNIGQMRVNQSPSPTDGYKPGDILCKRIAYKTDYHFSRLSMKENITKLDPKKALKIIDETGLWEYNYKNDGEKQASIIINDVDNDKKFKTPKPFVSNNGKGGERKDSVQIAYNSASIQELHRQLKIEQKKNESQGKKIDELTKLVKELQKQLTNS